MPVTDVIVADGEWQAEAPSIVIDAALARRAIENGELHNLILDCLNALELSGKFVVFAFEDENAK